MCAICTRLEHAHSNTHSECDSCMDNVMDIATGMLVRVRVGRRTDNAQTDPPSARTHSAKLSNTPRLERILRFVTSLNSCDRTVRDDTQRIAVRVSNWWSLCQQGVTLPVRIVLRTALYILLMCAQPSLSSLRIPGKNALRI